MAEFSAPSRTLDLLAELEALGFDDSAFSILHHFASAERIARHRHYCRMLQERGSSFRTNSNRFVQRRLAMVLAMYKAGQFTSGLPEVFHYLALATVSELPHDHQLLSNRVRP